MGAWEARMAREEGGRGMLLSSLLPRARSRAFPFELTSLPFRTLARRL